MKEARKREKKGKYSVYERMEKFLVLCERENMISVKSVDRTKFEGSKKKNQTIRLIKK